MKDNKFKRLSHRVGKMRIQSSGNEVEPGYKPDITVGDDSGNLIYILESEQKTDRKAFIGDVVKAQKYAEASKSSPTLIIVMQVQNNTTVKNIADHLQIYCSWLNQRLAGGLRFHRILVISDNDYRQSNAKKEALDSENFLRRRNQVHFK